MNIYESAEDYLEAILMIQERKGNVRSIDIAEEKNFSKASVSIAMKKLRENGYISMDKDGSIKLLPPGKEIAERIYERHQAFAKWFVQLGVDEKTAQEDACRIEHGLSDITFAKVKDFVETHILKEDGE
ncbi:MAG: metal-dependent transcriptional regulator [Solobacterium sp.]|nr:metal-dependent transcriptional regulator [Solobacterium sp.]MBR2669427.1 metal-dependent transcriptional regulator [Solobacterium sp.]